MKMLQTYMQSSIMNAQETTNMEKSVFTRLSEVKFQDHIERKGEKGRELSYLSWAWAWKYVKEIYPDAQYTIYEDANGIPYFTDGRTCWVKTGVTINGLEHIEYLPIMDFRNRSIPLENVTSMDMNKAIQRSITKAIGRHGLALCLYAGEDLWDDESPTLPTQPSAAVQARRQAAGRGTQQSQKAPYTPVSNEVFWNMVANYVRGIPSKTGQDYRTAWIVNTNAGEREIAMFDEAVVNYRINNNL